MRRPWTAIFLSVAASALVAPGHAQDAEAQARAAALDGIDHSLKQIVELLRIQVDNQRAELAVQRLDIARRELVARERELHSAESVRDGYAEQQEELEARIEAFGARTPEESNMSAEDFEFMQQQVDLEVEAVKQRLWRIDQRIIDLRKEITRVHEDLDVWEELVAGTFVPD